MLRRQQCIVGALCPEIKKPDFGEDIGRFAKPVRDMGI